MTKNQINRLRIQYNKVQVANLRELSDMLIEIENQILTLFVMRVKTHKGRIEGLRLIYTHIEEMLVNFDQDSAEPTGTVH